MMAPDSLFYAVDLADLIAVLVAAQAHHASLGFSIIDVRAIYDQITIAVP